MIEALDQLRRPEMHLLVELSSCRCNSTALAARTGYSRLVVHRSLRNLRAYGLIDREWEYYASIKKRYMIYRSLVPIRAVRHAAKRFGLDGLIPPSLYLEFRNSTLHSQPKTCEEDIL